MSDSETEVAAVERMIKQCGYDLSNVGDYDEDDIVVAISDGPDDDAETAIAEIRAMLPHGWSAEWTGNSDTDSDGGTTSDVVISREVQS